MAEQWYWKHRGETLGPLNTEDLEDLINHQRVFDRDQIRLADDHVWLPGATIKAWFADRKDSTSAEAASRLLENISQLRRTRSSEELSRADLVGELLEGGRKVAAGIFGRLGEGIAAVVIPFLKPLQYVVLNRITLVVVLAIVWLAIVLSGMDFGGFQNRRVYNRLTTIGDELQAMQARNASSQEWKAFRDETLQWLEPTIESLQKMDRRYPVSRARSRSWGFQTAATRDALIHAAIVLKGVVTHAPDQTGPSAEFFTTWMNKAHGFLSGDAIQQAQIADPKTGQGSFSPLVVGIIVVDTLLVVGGLFYWLRRRGAVENSRTPSIR